MNTLHTLTSTRPLATLSLLVALCAPFAGCAIDEFEEEFDTEFTVPKPNSALQAEPYTKSKRFKLKQDPNDAEFVKFLDAHLTAIAPQDSDLSFMNRLEVYVCASTEFADCGFDAKNGNDLLTLLATAEDFRPGQRSRSLDIVYKDDVRPFVSDQRVVLTWVVYPTGWGYDWPDDGITILTDVTLLIKADLL